MINMNRKQGIITTVLAVFCIVAFAGLASANSTTTGSAAFSRSGSGAVYDLNYILGSQNGNFAYIHGPNANDGGQITCTLSPTANANSVAKTYVHGSGGTAYLYANGPYGWYQLGAKTLDGSYGYITDNIDYSTNTLAVACYNGAGSCDAYFDMVITT